MNKEEKQQIRLKVWKELKNIALPDSRFHLNFEEYIPDFKDSINAHNQIIKSEEYKKSKLLFITPDNCLTTVREQAIRDGKTIIVSTYGIYRGFICISKNMVSEGNEIFASTLDGLEYFGKNISLNEIKNLGKVDLMLTGASAVSKNGVRFGKGHGFFDLEWGMFADLKIVDESTPIIAVVHDVQVVSFNLEPSNTDIIVDTIITNKQKLSTNRKKKRPSGIYWDLLEKGMLDATPPLRELKKILGKK
tara:strand:- start:10385 stop:11128 length:744 start_codon:yes stop_codon:yes gene_type:complete